MASNSFKGRDYTRKPKKVGNNNNLVQAFAYLAFAIKNGKVTKGEYIIPHEKRYSAQPFHKESGPWVVTNSPRRGRGGPMAG